MHASNQTVWQRNWWRVSFCCALAGCVIGYASTAAWAGGGGGSKPTPAPAGKTLDPGRSCVTTNGSDTSRPTIIKRASIKKPPPSGSSDGTDSASSSDVTESLPPKDSIHALALGNFSGCAQLEHGSVYCWGENGHGQLGNGTSVTNQYLPASQVTGLEHATSIAAAKDSFCALDDGVVKCWGLIADNQDGQDVFAITPQIMKNNLGTMTALYGDYLADQICGVVADTSALQCWTLKSLIPGTAYDSLTLSATFAPNNPNMNPANPLSMAMWGQKIYAITQKHYLVANTYDFGGPPPIWGWGAVDTSLPNSSAIAAGMKFFCGVINGGPTGTVKCWGDNTNNKLGSGIIGLETSEKKPLDVVGMTGGVTDVKAGMEHACALTQEGAVYCWGNNAYGEIGQPVSTPNAATAQKVKGLKTVKLLATDRFNSCVAQDSDSDGLADQVLCWGKINSGSGKPKVIFSVP